MFNANTSAPIIYSHTRGDNANRKAPIVETNDVDDVVDAVVDFKSIPMEAAIKPAVAAPNKQHI